MNRLKCIILFCASQSCFAQMSYNSCDTPLELCPNTTVTVNNIGANKTLCGGCEDDYNFCFAPANTIWMTFTTNDLGGDIQISFLNPSFVTQPGQGTGYNASLIEAVVPCNSTSYTLIGNCLSGAAGAQTINATALAPNTTYYISMSGDQTGTGVTLPAEFNIDITISGTAVTRPVPYMNIGTSSTICAGEITAIMAERFHCDDPGSFHWFVNGTLIGVDPDSIFFTSVLQNGAVIHVETSCFTSCPVTLTQTLPPVTVTEVIADAGSDITISEGEVTQLQGVASLNTTFLWAPGYALSDPSVLFPIANPSETTTYTLTVTDTVSGCTATDYVTVTVNKGLFIPNTFSPNNDGENDTWEIRGIETYPDCLVTIYNRWGQPVFQSTGYNKEKAWNGEGKTGKVNEGVYFYEIQLRDPEKQIVKGSITLIR